MPGTRNSAPSRSLLSPPVPSRPDLTFGHVAREPARHIATAQREALPPSGPGGAAQRERNQLHGAAASSRAAHGTAPATDLSAGPATPAKGSGTPMFRRGPRVRTTLPPMVDGVQRSVPGALAGLGGATSPPETSAVRFGPYLQTWLKTSSILNLLYKCIILFFFKLQVLM